MQGSHPAGENTEKGRQQHRKGELDSRFDQVGCSTGPARPGGLTRLVRRAVSRTDRESGRVGLKVGRSGRQFRWLSTLVGPGAALTGPELDGSIKSAARQAQPCSGSYRAGEKGRQPHRKRIESIVSSIKSAARQAQPGTGTYPAGEKGRLSHRPRIESIVGSIKSAARQAQPCKGPTRLVRRAGSSFDRES